MHFAGWLRINHIMFNKSERISPEMLNGLAPEYVDIRFFYQIKYPNSSSITNLLSKNRLLNSQLVSGINVQE